VVRRGYDAAAEAYGASRDLLENERHLDLFMKRLPPPASVLDIGCGSGVPIDRDLIEHGYDVVGIDVSPKQIELARERVPGGRFEVRDMVDLTPGDYEVDGIVSFYAIFHTPRERHGDVLRTLASFLRPEGVMLMTMGASEWEGTEPDFHGVEMYWSHYGPGENRRLIESAGLLVEVDDIFESNGERHQLILARRPA
jgi:SAM-dependent methyltransferase